MSKDNTVTRLIKAEEKRSGSVINLIASENISSPEVREALATSFADKYAEGYPGARYYKGNSIVDQVEELAIERARETFGLSAQSWDINVQALSGSPANLAVLEALVPHGAKIMGMQLSHGGHLTHGHSASMTGKLWKQIPYGVSDTTEQIDIDELRKIARKEKPALIIAGFTAYPRSVPWKEFRKIADEVGALLMVDMSHLAGLIAGGAYPSPFPYADVVTTTTHKTLRGPRGAIIFSKKDSRKLGERVDKAVFPGLQGGPHENNILAIAVALKQAQSKAFARYVRQVIDNAQELSEGLAQLGWRVIAGGTDSHLLLLDTWMEGKGIGGKEASDLLEKHGIVVNMNTIPFDTRSPKDPSGIRIGTAYETSKGKKKADMRMIAREIDKILRKNF